jgi:DNA-binding NtrC family response regulator
MSLKILIVDDEPDILNLYARIFREHNYSLTFAGSVNGAAALIKADHFDLLITDLVLGDGLGTELTQLFAKEFPGAKSLIVTGSLLKTIGLDLTGVAECMGKPIEIDRLLKAVARELEKPSRIACGSYQL